MNLNPLSRNPDPGSAPVVTGTYILQVYRSAFNQNEIDPTCIMCMEEPETVDHFLVKCSALAGVKQPIMDSIVRCAGGFLLDYLGLLN